MNDFTGTGGQATSAIRSSGIRRPQWHPALNVLQPIEALSINTMGELAAVESAMRERKR